MTARVIAGWDVVQSVARRPDPTAPLGVGAIAAEHGLGLSGASRLCAELDALGLLSRAEGYGAYRIGPAAVALSGAASASAARAVRYALTKAQQETGETAFLAARSGDLVSVIAAIDSGWTLHAPATLGEVIVDPRSAVAIAADGRSAAGIGAAPLACIESRTGRRIEVATPVLDGAGECVAVVAVRMPVYRGAQGVPRARRALQAARRILERAITDLPAASAPREAAPMPTGTVSALEASLRIVRHLAAGPDVLAGIAESCGLRADRTQRLLDSCLRAGVVHPGADPLSFALSWSVHGWHRAAAHPTLVASGRPRVAAAAHAAGVCAFVTVLKGMHSFTLVEELEVLGEGLRMLPWLGRRHPLVGSDGGPTLAMDFTADELRDVFPVRHTMAEFDTLLSRVERVQADGVLVIESIEEFGITSISAPVRDASGGVAAAACLVGSTEDLKPRLGAVTDAARALAAELTVLLDPAGVPA